MKHEMITQARPRGGRMKGTNVTCTCHAWSTFSNDLTPSRAGAWAKRVHAAHVERTTPTSDVEALKALIAKQTKWLNDEIAAGYISFVKDRRKALDRLLGELIEDMGRAETEQAAREYLITELKYSETEVANMPYAEAMSLAGLEG